MTKLETLQRKIIESIHGKHYEEAVKDELQEGCIIWDKVYEKEEVYFKSLVKAGFIRGEFEIIGLPITLARILQALQKNDTEITGIESLDEEGSIVLFFGGKCDEVYWQLTDSYGKELTLEDQSEEVWDKLLKLFNYNRI